MVSETTGNERNMNRTLKAILLSAGLCSIPNLCFSAVVYQAVDNGQYYPTNLESGDQINLAGTDRTLSQFSFSYFFSGASVTSQTWTLRLYANDGTTNSPGTMLFSGDPVPLSLGNNGYSTYDVGFGLAVPPVILPDSFTWTVQFSNLAANENAGLLLSGPPSTGGNFNDFWQKDGSGNWSLMTLTGQTFSEFGAKVSAVPEPGVLALGGLGALLLAGLKRFRKGPG